MIIIIETSLKMSAAQLSQHTACLLYVEQVLPFRANDDNFCNKNFCRFTSNSGHLKVQL